MKSKGLKIRRNNKRDKITKLRGKERRSKPERNKQKRSR